MGKCEVRGASTNDHVDGSAATTCVERKENRGGQEKHRERSGEAKPKNRKIETRGANDECEG